MSQITSQQKQILVRAFISDERFRKYNVDIAKRLGGIEYAILLNDLVDQDAYLTRENILVSHVKYGDGLMYYTQAQAYDRCGINRDSFESGIKLFIDLGFIKDAVVFGIPPKRHFKMDLVAIYDWIFSNKDYKMRKPANQDGETRKSICGNPHTNDNYNESKKKSINRSTPLPPQNETPTKNKSSSFERERIGFFDPLKYKLRNGDLLKQVTARSFLKKMQDPLMAKIISANVAWYEKQMDEGIKPKKSHEAYLQWAIEKNMAAKEDVKWRNEMYAKVMKEEHKLSGLHILKTVVQLDKKNGSRPESISLNISETAFSDAVDAYITQQKNKD